MNFDDASMAHFEWKAKLRTYLGRPDGSLKAASIEPDNQCALGKWIQAEGAKHIGDPVFGELRQAHATFHQSAAALVRRADAGEKVNAEVALGARSPFNELSERVVALIAEMKKKSVATTSR